MVHCVWLHEREPEYESWFRTVSVDEANVVTRLSHYRHLHIAYTAVHCNVLQLFDAACVSLRTVQKLEVIGLCSATLHSVSQLNTLHAAESLARS
jgi:hypothetical protein